MPVPTYPKSRYRPRSAPNLTSKDERMRLSRSALKGFFRVAERWRLSADDAKELLGGITNGTYYRMKKDLARRVLGMDTLLRISYLLGIFRALNLLHGQPLADDWINRPNSNRIFGGGTPLGYIRCGGLPAMSRVRRLLDAR